MTNLPIELAKAREARTQAWNEYMQVIERDHTYAEYHEALTKAGAADEVVSRWYQRWQAVGGTSDIESIVDAELFLNAMETCLVDPMHINSRDELTPKVARFMDDMTDYLDLKATEEHARY